MVKMGSNIKFICSYIMANPGARHKDIREALCRHNGIDPKVKRGHYTIYFSHLRNGRNYDHLWVNLNGRYWLTGDGLLIAM